MQLKTMAAALATLLIGIQPAAHAQYNDSRVNLAVLGQGPAQLYAQDALTDTRRLNRSITGPTWSESLYMRVHRKLPQRFYLNVINEASGRLETNPFQFPNDPTVVQQKLLGTIQLNQLPQVQRNTVNNYLNEVNATNAVFREQPNITAGWAVTPQTKIYGNYFLLADRFAQNAVLNSTTQSIGGGVQHDTPLTRKLNLQTNFQVREMYQSRMPHMFDYLPGATLSYTLSPTKICYANAILQIRSKNPFAESISEIDPFCTLGMISRHGRWQLCASTTLLKNLRQPFGHNAIFPENSSCWICDFEVDRQLSKQHSGMQAFVRAEPIVNFQSNNTLGMSGFDFRLYSGLRLTLGKPALTASLNQIRHQM